MMCSKSTATTPPGPAASPPCSIGIAHFFRDEKAGRAVPQVGFQKLRRQLYSSGATPTSPSTFAPPRAPKTTSPILLSASCPASPTGFNKKHQKPSTPCSKPGSPAPPSPNIKSSSLLTTSPSRLNFYATAFFCQPPVIAPITRNPKTAQPASIATSAKGCISKT